MPKRNSNKIRKDHQKFNKLKLFQILVLQKQKCVLNVRKGRKTYFQN